MENKTYKFKFWPIKEINSLIGHTNLSYCWRFFFFNNKFKYGVLWILLGFMENIFIISDTKTKDSYTHLIN